MPLDPADAALAVALSTPLPDEGDDGRLLTLPELAAASGLALPVLEAIEREGLLIPREDGAPPRYAAADVGVVRAGLALLDAGLPLGELLGLARHADEALRGVADQAVDVFLRFVRDPVRGATEDADEAGATLVAAFERMLPAAADLVGAHMRRLVVAAARARLRQEAADTAS